MAGDAVSRIPRALRMALLTFSVLALELALIRWVAGQIRIAAYFTNLVLLASFLGLGLGVGLGPKRPELVRACVPVLALLALILATSEQTGLCFVRFPDTSMSLWGGDTSGTAADFALAALMMTACFWAIAIVFAMVGAAVGRLFDEMPPLEAYGADIAGSLAGTIAMSFVAWLGAPPPVWFALGALPLVVVTRSWWTLLAAVVVIGAAWYSIGSAVFSPYNRILVQPIADADARPGEYQLDVNRDFHQYLYDLKPDPDHPDEWRDFTRRVYELPFRITDGNDRTALVVAAGAGNDVAAALRSGIASVTSVDIDPRIIAIGRELHPEHPYSDPRTKPVVNDARAFFEQNPDLR